MVVLGVASSGFAASRYEAHGLKTHHDVGGDSFTHVNTRRSSPSGSSGSGNLFDPSCQFEEPDHHHDHYRILGGLDDDLNGWIRGIKVAGSF